MSELLGSKRIALLFYTSAEYSTRILQSVELLKMHGAEISLFSTFPNSKVENVFKEIVCVDSFDYPNTKPRRLSKNKIFRVAKVQFVRLLDVAKMYFGIGVRQRGLYQELDSRKNDFDLYWAVDVVSLEAAVLASEKTGTPVIYETLDLVTEYKGVLASIRTRAEEKYISRIAKFVTAGDEYAKHYNEKYPELKPTQKPFVLYNTTPQEFKVIKPTGEKRRLLFFGNLAYDRPIEIIMEALSKIEGNFDFTFMGRNLNGQKSFDLIDSYGLGSRVKILEPCDPFEGVQVAHEYDIGIAPLGGCNLNERLAPTGKIGTYLNAGLAIVASDLPGMRSAVGQVPVFWVENPTVQSWAQQLQAAIDAPRSELDNRKSSALSRFNEISFDAKSSDYVQLFVDALKEKPSFE